MPSITRSLERCNSFSEEIDLCIPSFRVESDVFQVSEWLCLSTRHGTSWKSHCTIRLPLHLFGVFLTGDYGSGNPALLTTHRTIISAAVRLHSIFKGCTIETNVTSGSTLCRSDALLLHHPYGAPLPRAIYSPLASLICAINPQAVTNIRGW